MKFRIVEKPASKEPAPVDITVRMDGGYVALQADDEPLLWLTTNGQVLLRSAESEATRKRLESMGFQLTPKNTVAIK